MVQSCWDVGDLQTMMLKFDSRSRKCGEMLRLTAVDHWSGCRVNLSSDQIHPFSILPIVTISIQFADSYYLPFSFLVDN